MEQIEQGLRAMSEPRNTSGPEHADGSTELWKRALEISRAEERAGLVHPAVDRETTPRGRRLLIALNAVGVAAMVVLAVGVWTVVRTKPVTDTPEMASNEVARAPVEDQQFENSFFGDKAVSDDSVEAQFTEDALAMAKERRDAAPSYTPTPYGGRQQEPVPELTADRLIADAGESLDSEFTRLVEPSSAARSRAAQPTTELEKPTDTPRELAAARDEVDMDVAFADPTAGVDASHPGLMQMRMAPEEGLEFEAGDASLMAFDPYLVNANIVIEVSDIDAAINALADLPRADLDEFSVIVPDESKDEAEPIDAFVLNMAPARLEQTLGEIRGLGRVVEERRELDTPARRAGSAIDWALVNTSSNFQALESVIEAQGLTEHERAHRHLPANDAEQLEAVRSAFTEIARRLDVTRRSMNLSQINVIIRQAPEPSAIEE